jgi:dolichol-phosphate mannosyltransferase
MRLEEEPLLSIIVPAYNEAENIPRLLERVHRALQGISYEIVLVDDGSPDGTSEIAKGFAEERGEG